MPMQTQAVPTPVDEIKVKVCEECSADAVIERLGYTRGFLVFEL